MMELVFLLEEASAKALLQKLLPRFFPDIGTLHFIVFEGKQDMEKQLTRKLRGWQKPDSHFIVLRDKDAEDCRKLKTCSANVPATTPAMIPPIIAKLLPPPLPI